MAELGHMRAASVVSHNDNATDAVYWDIDGLDRTDPLLVQAVEELGDAAGGSRAKLRVEMTPGPEPSWHISEYDGMERVEHGSGS